MCSLDIATECFQDPPSAPPPPFSTTQPPVPPSVPPPAPVPATIPLPGLLVPGDDSSAMEVLHFLYHILTANPLARSVLTQTKIIPQLNLQVPPPTQWPVSVPKKFDFNSSCDYIGGVIAHSLKQSSAY